MLHETVMKGLLVEVRTELRETPRDIKMLQDTRAGSHSTLKGEGRK